MHDKLDKAVRNSRRTQRHNSWIQEAEGVERRNKKIEELKGENDILRASIDYSSDIKGKGQSIIESLSM